MDPIGSRLVTSLMMSRDSVVTRHNVQSRRIPKLGLESTIRV